MKIITKREELKAYLGAEVQELLFSIYDGFVRVVDPVTNSVEVTTDDLIEVQNKPEAACFEIWNKNKVCSNCTSLRAIVNNEPISKIETRDGLVYMVHSIPFKLPEGRKVALEVLKILNKIPVQLGVYNYPDTDFITLLHAVDRLNERVYKDALTNAFNREYLTVKLADLITRGNCTLLMVDIDNFKRINDTYGHPVGDAILQRCVGVISAHLRDKDIIVRYGGDEFLIVLVNIRKKQAKEIISRLQQAVTDNSFEYESKSINYDVSIGSYSVTKRNLDLTEIMKRVDHSMYEVKRRKQRMGRLITGQAAQGVSDP